MDNKFCYELPSGLNNWGQVTNMPESLRKIGENVFEKGKDPLSTLVPKASMPLRKRVKKKKANISIFN